MNSKQCDKAYGGSHLKQSVSCLYAQTLYLSLSLTHTHMHKRAHALSLSLSLTHTHTHTHTLFRRYLCLSLTVCLLNTHASDILLSCASEDIESALSRLGVVSRSKLIQEKPRNRDVELPFLYYIDFMDVTAINTGWRLFHLLIYYYYYFYFLFLFFSKGDGHWEMGIECIKKKKNGGGDARKQISVKEKTGGKKKDSKINIFENGLNCVVTHVCPFLFSFLVCRLLSLHLPSSVCLPVIFRLFICRLLFVHLP